MAQTKKQKAVLNKWLKALESGLYKQGTSALVTAGEKGDYFCCLGVLCDIAVRSKVIPAPTAKLAGHSLTYQKETSYLPKVVRSLVGLKSKYEEHRLAELNDEGASFKKIAKYIRRNEAELFV